MSGTLELHSEAYLDTVRNSGGSGRPTKPLHVLVNLQPDRHQPLQRTKKTKVIMQIHDKMTSTDSVQNFSKLASLGFRQHPHGCHQKPSSDGEPNS